MARLSPGRSRKLSEEVDIDKITKTLTDEGIKNFPINTTKGTQHYFPSKSGKENVFMRSENGEYVLDVYAANKPDFRELRSCNDQEIIHNCRRAYNDKLNSYDDTLDDKYMSRFAEKEGESMKEIKVGDTVDILEFRKYEDKARVTEIGKIRGGYFAGRPFVSAYQSWGKDHAPGSTAGHNFCFMKSVGNGEWIDLDNDTLLDPKYWPYLDNLFGYNKEFQEKEFSRKLKEFIQKEASRRITEGISPTKTLVGFIRSGYCELKEPEILEFKQFLADEKGIYEEDYKRFRPLSEWQEYLEDFKEYKETAEDNDDKHSRVAESKSLKEGYDDYEDIEDNPEIWDEIDEIERGGFDAFDNSDLSDDPKVIQRSIDMEYWKEKLPELSDIELGNLLDRIDSGDVPSQIEDYLAGYGHPEFIEDMLDPEKITVQNVYDNLKKEAETEGTVRDEDGYPCKDTSDNRLMEIIKYQMDSFVWEAADCTGVTDFLETFGPYKDLPKIGDAYNKVLTQAKQFNELAEGLMVRERIKIPK